MTAEIFETDPNENDDADLSVSTTVSRSKKSKDAVESDHFIPLFPDADKTPANVVHEIHIYKRNGADDGFKGSVAPSTSLLQIARLYGNGLYDFHAVKADGKVLRRAPNQKIDLPANVLAAAKDPARPASAPIDVTLLTFQRDAHEKDSARIVDIAKEASTASREQASNTIKMVQETAAQSSTRDREFFGAMMSTQQTFFSAMLQTQQQQHAQQMEIMRANAAQERERMEHAHQRAMQANDPSTLIALFERGLSAGQGMNSDDQNPITVIGNTVMGGLKEVRQMMALKALQNKGATRSLPSRGTSTPGPKQARPNPGKRPAQVTSGEVPPIEKLMKFKDLAERKGMRVSALLDDLASQMQELPDRTVEEVDAMVAAEEAASETEEETDESPEESSSSEAP